MRIIFNPILDTRLILAYHENRFVLIEKKLTEFFDTTNQSDTSEYESTNDNRSLLIIKNANPPAQPD